MTNHVVGIDPGTTTGLAFWKEGYTEKPVTMTFPITDVMTSLASMHSVYPITAIAIERFQTSGRLSKYGLETIDLVGQVKGWAFAMGIPVTIYPPQSRRAWQKHDTKTKHEDDARAHLLHYLQNHFGLRF